MTVGPGHFAALSAIVFAIGLYGVLSRRNALHSLLGLVVLFTAPVIALVGFAHTGHGGGGPPMGDVLAVMAMVATAAVAGVGLAVVLHLWRRIESADLDELVDTETG